MPFGTRSPLPLQFEFQNVDLSHADVLFSTIFQQVKLFSQFLNAEGVDYPAGEKALRFRKFRTSLKEVVKINRLVYEGVLASDWLLKVRLENRPLKIQIYFPSVSRTRGSPLLTL